MKSYIKGLITGLLIGAVIFAVPAIAENIDALFNQVRINVNGVDQISWGEDINLGDGESTPSSILYNGTTYLPMRKLGELSGQKIYWNGDSKTVAMTGQQKNINVVAEKPDKNGNVWKYYTFKDADGNNYLGVKDETRGYERVYRISGNIEITDNEICFIKIEENSASLPASNYGEIVKLSFDNDENTQDGEKLKSISYLGNGGVSDGYAYYVENIPGNASHTELWVYNFHNGETAYYKGHTSTTMYIQNEQNNENDIVFKCIETYIHGEQSAIEIVYDKTTNTFGTPIEKAIGQSEE